MDLPRSCESAYIVRLPDRGVRFGSVRWSLVLGLAACGGTQARHATPGSPVSLGGPARASLPSGSPETRGVRGVVPGSVAMTATPAWLLAVCLGNALLHPICPRLGPWAGQSHTTTRPLGFCNDRRGRDLVLGGHYARLESGRCVMAGWGYEATGELPFDPAAGDRLSAWNGRRWIALDSESGLFAPPIHVHVEIQAARSQGPMIDGWPTRTEPIADSLLNSGRTTPVSLGWVHWYGTHGQLVLEPGYPAGGEWGGHLVYRFSTTHVSYAITLHAWTAALRVTGSHQTRVIRRQSGPALPHVIATLKTIVGSALKP